MRLGVYADLLYRSDGETISTDRAFVRFVTSLPPRVEEIVIFGRLDARPGRSPYALPRRGVRFVPLPFYPRINALYSYVRAARGSLRIFAAELERLDAVWIFGPHPLAVLFALVARRRRKPLVLGVRQDYTRYIGKRLPSRLWLWAVPVAAALDQLFRFLAREVPTVAVGEHLARRYAGGRASVLATGFSLVSAHELAALDEALAKRWDGDELRLLSVGRLDPEKNPHLLLDVIARLRAHDARWGLAVAGDGDLAATVRRRARELELLPHIDFLGYIPNGPPLWDQYRRSHAFLHVSLTEGLPQVLFEAHAAGLPVVATNVGGVASAVRDAAILVPRGDADAVVGALARLTADAELRRRLITQGLELAAQETMEAQLDRLASFIHREAGAL